MQFFMNLFTSFLCITIFDILASWVCTVDCHVLLSWSLPKLVFLQVTCLLMTGLLFWALLEDIQTCVRIRVFSNKMFLFIRIASFYEAATYFLLLLKPPAVNLCGPDLKRCWRLVMPSDLSASYGQCNPQHILIFDLQLEYTFISADGFCSNWSDL